MTFEIHCADCFEWLTRQPKESFHAVVTDPPYGLEEFSRVNLEKLKMKRGGVWRIPPKIGGIERAPLPRFTVKARDKYPFMYTFFNEWARLIKNILVPGGHVFIASTPLFLHVVSSAIVDAEFEPRGIIVRVVKTLRGGFRPKGAEKEFQGVCSMPRAYWEPWGLFRKPLETGLTLAENLRKNKAGGLRRNPDGMPFSDLIVSERTPLIEEKIAPHPTLKPQSFMRRLVWAALPLGKGNILDPFCGVGSTLASAEALGYYGVGVEILSEYVEIAERAIPKLASLKVNPWKIKSTNHVLARTILLNNNLTKFLGVS